MMADQLQPSRDELLRLLRVFRGRETITADAIKRADAILDGVDAAILEARAANHAAIEAARDLAVSTPQVGDLVDVAIYPPGPGGPQTAIGSLRGYVIAAGAEFNVELIDDEEDVAETLRRADVMVADLVWVDGSESGEIRHPILENCQREWLRVVERKVDR